MGIQIIGQERLTLLCNVTGSPFLFMKKGKRMDKVGKEYVQVIPSCWKAEKNLINHIPEVRKNGDTYITWLPGRFAPIFDFNL